MLNGIEVEMTWTNNRKTYETKGYKYTKKGDKFKVQIKDLAPTSHVDIPLICDYCGKEYTAKMKNYYNSNINGIIHKDACKDCSHLKKEESNLLKYGVKDVNQKEITINKIKEEFLERGYILLEDKYINNKTKMKYYCKKHANEIQQIAYHDFTQCEFGCHYCGKESMAEKQKLPYSKVKVLFKKNNYKLLTMESEYINTKQELKYICVKHPQYVQHISYSTLKQGHGCKYCDNERKLGDTSPVWKGGITPLHNHLRKIIDNWKRDSIKNCNRKCILTGKQSSLVHHLYGFDLILQELIKELDLNINDFRKIDTGDISKDKLNIIEQKCIELHYKHGLGVCLTKKIHKLFHKEYGYGNNTPEQFQEFKQRYNNHEFDEILKIDNNKLNNTLNNIDKNKEIS